MSDHTVTMASGQEVGMLHEELVAKISAEWTDSRCPVCAKYVQQAGHGPHMASHKRMAGLMPAKKQPKKAKAKPKAKKPDPVEMPPLYETLSGVLYGYVGETIPVSMLAEVSEWMASTEHLFNALNNKETK